MSDSSRSTSSEKSRLSAEERAKLVGPCYGDGITGPTQCDESFMCELHSRIAAQITAAQESAKAEGIKLGREQEQMEAFNQGHSKGQERMRERCAYIITPESSADYYGGVHNFAWAMNMKIKALPLEEPK